MFEKVNRCITSSIARRALQGVLEVRDSLQRGVSAFFMQCERAIETNFRTVVMILICGLLTSTAIHNRIVWAEESDPAFDFLATNLTIFDPADGHVIGHGRYTSSRSGGNNLIRGENKYLDGARDLELDYLKPGAAGEAPTLVRHEYSSFNADGSPQFVESFDPATGAAS